MTAEELDVIEQEKAARVIAAAVREKPLAIERANAPDAAERAEEARLLAGTPVGFALSLGMHPYGWQAEVLTWFEDTTELVKGSLCTPNGAGKSAVVDAILALWWITVHPQGMVVITTKDSKQLDNQLWPAIERHKGKFPGYDFIERMVRNNQGGFIIGFTTDDPGRAEGWHKINDFTGPLLMIEDEAKSISDGIDMAIDRCTYNAKLLSSSPGLTEGFFWKSHSENQPAAPLGYHHMQVGLKDCPHIPKSRIDNIIANYGEDHWFTRSTLYGEFTDADSDVIKVIPKQIVVNAMKSPPLFVPGGKRAFLDFGAGRAENVFTLREGNKISQVCWKDPDPMRAVGDFIKLFVKNTLLPSEIKGDAGGIGIPILARFNELGWPIIGVNNESEPRNKLRYPNKGAEQWHEAPNKIVGMILPDDPILLEQATGRRAAPVGAGLLGLETKKDMKERGVPSPDRADGLVGVLDDDIEAASVLFDGEGLKKLELLARAAGRVERGKLELSEDQVSYDRATDGWLTVHEKPITNMRYLLIVSPFRHDDVLAHHVLIVVRAAYLDEQTQKMVPARLAAKVNMVPFRLDASPLVTMIKKVSLWYGRCLVVPIVNDRGDVIETLLKNAVHIYAREDDEIHRSGRRQQNIIRFGWENNDFNRSMWIGALAEAIRNDAIVVEDIPTVMELYQLTGAERGFREAEALGVGLQLIRRATTYLKAATETRWDIKEQQRPDPERIQYS